MIDRMGIIRHPTIKHWCECRHSYTSLRNYHLEISTSINLWDATLPGCLSTTHDYDDDDDYSHSQPHTRTTQTRTHFSRHSFIHSFDRMIRSSINHGNHGSFEPCTILDICVYISLLSTRRHHDEYSLFEMFELSIIWHCSNHQHQHHD